MLPHKRFTSNQECLLPKPEQGLQNISLSSLPDSVNSTRAFLAVVNAIASPPTVLVNLVIIWTILKKESLRGRSYNVLLAVLAFTDLLSGLVAKPLSVLHLVCAMKDCKIDCIYTIVAIPTLLCYLLTLYTITLTSIERYLAIEFPNFYRAKVTSKRVLIVTILTWILMILAPIVGQNVQGNHRNSMRRTSSLIVAGGNVLITVFCTAKVHLIAARQRRITHARAVEVQELENEQEAERSRKIEQQKQRLRDYKISVTAGVLLVVAVICFCPFIIMLILQIKNGNNLPAEFKILAPPVAFTFINLQSLVDPIVMSLRLSYIRKGVRERLFAFIH